MRPKPQFTRSKIRWDHDFRSGTILVFASNEDPWRFHFQLQGSRREINYGYGLELATHERAMTVLREHGGSGVMVVLIPSLKKLMRETMDRHRATSLFSLFGVGNRAALYRSWANDFEGFQGKPLETGLGSSGDRGGCRWERIHAYS